ELMSTRARNALTSSEWTGTLPVAGAALGSLPFGDTAAVVVPASLMASYYARSALHSRLLALLFSFELGERLGKLVLFGRRSGWSTGHTHLGRDRLLRSFGRRRSDAHLSLEREQIVLCAGGLLELAEFLRERIAGVLLRDLAGRFGLRFHLVDL